MSPKLRMRQRSSARARHDGPGELVARGPGRRHAITIRSISANGLGAELLSASAAELPRGASITVLLAARNDTIELPGQIAWSVHGERPASTGAVGVRLFVELAPAATRRLFATWLEEIAAGASGDP
jgi:hypothetical protein